MQREKQRTYLVAVGVAIALAGLGGDTVVAGKASASTSKRVAYVDYVVDGDTVRLKSGRVVRLIGYDTPERGKRYYAKAKRSLDDFIPASGRVRLVNPSSTDDTDRYGRMLRYLRVNQRDAGVRLIKQGYGHARYDSRDGYDWHPMQATYRRIDANTKDLWKIPKPPSSGGSGGGGGGGCKPGYSPCLPIVGDLDCGDIPEWKKPIRVTGSDPYRLDADGDGLGCE